MMIEREADQSRGERGSPRPLAPEVVAARIVLRVAELRLLAAWTMACTHKFGSVIDVRFTPDATTLLRSSEMTRCANNGHCRCRRHLEKSLFAPVTNVTVLG
jgi:hypothetical protein